MPGCNDNTVVTHTTVVFLPVAKQIRTAQQLTVLRSSSWSCCCLSFACCSRWVSACTRLYSRRQELAHSEFCHSKLAAAQAVVVQHDLCADAGTVVIAGQLQVCVLTSATTLQETPPDLKGWKQQ
jgi:hypothetical protein